MNCLSRKHPRPRPLTVVYNLHVHTDIRNFVMEWSEVSQLETSRQVFLEHQIEKSDVLYWVRNLLSYQSDFTQGPSLVFNIDCVGRNIILSLSDFTKRSE